MAQFLIIVAATPFLVFGLGHGLYTLMDLKRPRAFTPPDPALRQAMQESSVRFERQKLVVQLSVSVNREPRRLRHYTLIDVEWLKDKGAA